MAAARPGAAGRGRHCTQSTRLPRRWRACCSHPVAQPERVTPLASAAPPSPACRVLALWGARREERGRAARPRGRRGRTAGVQRVDDVGRARRAWPAASRLWAASRSPAGADPPPSLISIPAPRAGSAQRSEVPRVPDPKRMRPDRIADSLRRPTDERIVMSGWSSDRLRPALDRRPRRAAPPRACRPSSLRSARQGRTAVRRRALRDVRLVGRRQDHRRHPRPAPSSFSRMAATGATRPESVSTPVMATPSRAGRPANAETRATASVTRRRAVLRPGGFGQVVRWRRRRARQRCTSEPNPGDGAPDREGIRERPCLRPPVFDPGRCSSVTPAGPGRSLGRSPPQVSLQEGSWHGRSHGLRRCGVGTTDAQTLESRADIRYAALCSRRQPCRILANVEVPSIWSRPWA